MLAPVKALIVALSALLLVLAYAPAAKANAAPANATAVADQDKIPALHELQRVVVRVSLSQQRMEVFHEGRKLFDWPVSTARKGKITPLGTWNGAQWLSKNHRSSLYDGAPMPYSIFFNGNYAIHGTDQIRKLGSPASAGCIRLHPDNARILFNMVRAEGKANLRVEVVR